MRQLTKLLKWILTLLGGLTACIVMSSCVYFQLFEPYLNPKKYYREMNQIKAELNKMENVEVLNIWGHHDITLEEISARLKIKDKGEIVLLSLNPDDNNYPKRVYIREIGGYSFTVFHCNSGIGSTLDIGTEGSLIHLFKMEFNTVKDVIDNYDLILETVRTLKTSPEVNYFSWNNRWAIEEYLFVHNKTSTDQDPIFDLAGVFSLAEFAKNLEWDKNCPNARRHSN
jgi:hypothetical protein